MAHLTPEAKALVKAFTAVTVKHDYLQKADDELSLLIEEHTDATHVLICGPGGVGKSKMLKVVAERFILDATDRFVVPVLLLEPIPSDLGPYLRLDYYLQILTALQDHILVKEILGPVAHLMDAPRATRSKWGATDWLKARMTAEQALIRAQVQTVFADEGHRVMQGDGKHSVDDQLEWLKSLSNRTNVLHVLAGPYALFGFRNTMGQLARRGRDIHFQRYHMNVKEERQEFVAALKYLLERIPLDVDLDAFLLRWKWFAEGSVGCIGVLKDWLVDALKAALAQGETRLTEDILMRTMLHPAKRLSLETEARMGEHKVATHDLESAKQLQALLKKPAPTENAKAAPPIKTMPESPPPDQAEQEAELVVATLPMPQVTPKPTKRRVGQRAPERDLVGEASAPASPQATRCSFMEEIPVTLSQMEEAGVFRFECPTCKATQTIKPKGERVKFSWHPKRTTNTPNHGSRWVKRENVWRLISNE